MRELRLDSQEAGELARLWWLPLCLGLLSLAAGVVVLAKPDNSLKTLAVIAGIFILLDGIVELAMAFGRSTANRGLVALIGTLDLIVGILLIRHPIAGVQAVALFIGIWLIAAGVIRAVMAFESPGERLGRILIGGLEALFGIVIVSSAHIGFATLALLVGLSFIANGFGMITFGIFLRAARSNLRPPGAAAA